MICYVNDILKTNGESVESMISSVFEDKNHIKRINNKFKAQSIKNFDIERYLSVAYVFKQFILNSQIKSFLCLNTALPKQGSKFDINILKDLFELVIKETKVKINKNYLVVLRSGATFEANKKEVLNRLAKGEKIFLISSYATLGAGQNLPYEIPETEQLVNLNDNIDINDPRNLKKDFDAIYLGEISNILTNLYNENDEFTNKELYHYISQVENLYENSEISYDTLEIAICNGFRKLKNPQYKVYDLITNKAYLSKTGYITKQTIQGIGRLNRTFNKRKVIPIYISSSVYLFFDTHIAEKEIVSPEIEELIHFLEKRGDIPYDDNNFQAERISMETRNHIFEVLSNDWTESIIDYWKRLRDMVLKYPTVDEKMYQKDILFMEYYIHNTHCTDYNSYFFHEYNDFAKVNVFFEESKEKACLTMRKNIPDVEIETIKECSFDNSRLSEILKYEGMKEYFIKMKYATSFKSKKYMMCPVLYQNIYKGALGEVAGKFILEKELNIELKELNSEYFEMFDYKLSDDIYIDFKHWRRNSVDKKTYLEKINKKLEEVNGKKVYIINILDDNDSFDQINMTYHGRIIEVPFLLDTKNYKANQKIINMLREDLL